MSFFLFAGCKLLQVTDRVSVSEGMYVRVYGSYVSQQAGKMISAYSISQVTDFNEITFHYLEVFHTHYLLTQPNVAHHAASSAVADVSMNVVAGDGTFTPVQQAVGGKEEEGRGRGETR